MCVPIGFTESFFVRCIVCGGKKKKKMVRCLFLSVPFIYRMVLDRNIYRGWCVHERRKIKMCGEVPDFHFCFSLMRCALLCTGQMPDTKNFFLVTKIFFYKILNTMVCRLENFTNINPQVKFEISIFLFVNFFQRRIFTKKFMNIMYLFILTIEFCLPDLVIHGKHFIFLQVFFHKWYSRASPVAYSLREIIN